MTLHPVKQFKYQYRLESFFHQRKIIELRQKRLELQRKLYPMQNEMLDNSRLAHRFMYRPRIFTGRCRYCQNYDFYNRNWYSSTLSNPKRGIESSYLNAIRESIRQIMSKTDANHSNDSLRFLKINYAYVKPDSLFGIDYLLNADFAKTQVPSFTIPNIYMRQTYADLMFRDLTPIKPDETFPKADFFKKIFDFQADSQVDQSLNDDEALLGNTEETICFVLPLSGRLDTFRKFMKNFEDVCLKTSENVELAIVLFSNGSLDKDIGTIVNRTVSLLEVKYPRASFIVVQLAQNFSRSIACEAGMAAFASKNSLLFFIDVDMMFTMDVLVRIRLNTIRNTQVYFPIVFSQYDPEQLAKLNTTNMHHGPLTIHGDLGYWRFYGFGILSVYYEDIKMVGGYDTTIKGWGKEDVDLYDRFSASNLKVFRSVDRGLVHMYHKIICNPNLTNEQMDMCIGTLMASQASQRTLARAVYKHGKL